MRKENVAELVKFLSVYSDKVQNVALSLRDFVWQLYPECNELIYDNYNALAFGWSLTDKAGDVFCSIAVFKNYVNFGFNRGTEFPDEQNLLMGNGSLYRYMRIDDMADFPAAYLRQLLAMAFENAQGRVKPGKENLKGATIVKSISPVKKRPL